MIYKILKIVGYFTNRKVIIILIIDNFNYSNVFAILNSLIVGNTSTNYSYQTYLNFYLNENVKITSGTGTTSNPFILSF